MLNCSRDKNEGTYRSEEGREGARYVIPDLSYYWDWEGAQEQSEQKWWHYPSYIILPAVQM